VSRTFSVPDAPTDPDPAPDPGPEAAPAGDVKGGRVRALGRSAWLQAAVTAGATVLVIWPGWISPSYRAAMEQLDPRMVKYLYVVLGGLIVVAAVRAVAAPGRLLLPVGLRRWTGPAALVGSMFAFCVPLFAAWQTGLWWGTIGGGVPYSDPHIYFGGAERLLFFDDLDVYNSRRPLNAMFLAVRLAVTSLDLRLALILGAMAMGAATWFAARAVARDLGPVAGFALFVGIFGFARVYGPTPMTEVLGVTIGALAFSVIWNAVSTRNRWLAVGGILLLTIALDARSGVLLLPFVLPLWLAFHFRGKRRYDWRMLGACAAAVVLGVSMNSVALATLGGDSSNVMGNGGFLVYGMSKGKAAWNPFDPAWHLVLNEHPETWKMSDPDRNRFVNARAREQVLAHPEVFLGAAIQSEFNYLRIAKQEILLDVPINRHRPVMAGVALAIAVAFALRARRDRWWQLLVDLGLFASMVVVVPILVSYVPSNTPPQWVSPALAVAAFVAFIVIGTRRLAHTPHLVMALVGVGATAVCLPMLGVDTVRVFAATSPFAALPLALAAAVMTRAPGLRPAAAEVAAAAPAPAPAGWKQRPARAAAAPLVAGAALVAVVFLGPPIAMAAVERPETPTRLCPDGRPAEPLIGGVAAQFVPDREGRTVTQVKSSMMVAQLPLFQPVPGKHLTGIDPPWTLIHGLTVTGTDRFAVVEALVPAPRASALYLCGDVLHDPETDATFSIYPDPVDMFRGVPLPPL